MASNWLVLAASLLSLYCYVQFRALRRNIAKAKQSGFPYVVAPVYFRQLWWMILGPLFSKLLRNLPNAWSEKWLPLSVFGRVWHAGYSPFALIGSDSFIMVSSGGNVLWTCDPDAILQFSRRHHDFVKPVEMLGMLNMYGPTITGTEGEESRLYRKTAGPSFNDRTHDSVWTETLGQTTALLETWKALDRPITQLNKDLARLTLHLISSVCFDRQMDSAKANDLPDTSTKNHKMSYQEAIGSMLDNIPILFTVPFPVVKTLPTAAFKKAKASYDEWKAYMEEMRDETGQKLVRDGPRNDMSILESFVRAGQDSSPDATSPKIPPEAVLGNIFIFIMAGYETSANTLNYAILLLACYPEIQKAMQSDIDKILDNRPSSQWSFESDFPRLLDGFVGAVMNETLRLFSVLPFHPKTTREAPVPMTLGDREYTVPPDTLILMNTSATHRNPKIWPSAAPKCGDGPPHPVSSFNPGQWLPNKSNKDGSASSFSPTPGSWIPFSEGPRACLGKRFAQAEFCAAIAGIFKDYSVELVVDNGDVETKEVKKSDWERARHAAEKELSDGVGFMMSLKMTGTVPIRLVKRGQEQNVH